MNKKIFTEKSIVVNMNDSLENPKDNCIEVIHNDIEMTEVEYQKKMKAQKERKEKLQNLIIDMMVDYALAKRNGLLKK